MEIIHLQAQATVNCIYDPGITVPVFRCSAASGYKTSTLSLSNSSGGQYTSLLNTIDGEFSVHEDGQEGDTYNYEQFTDTSFFVNVSDGSTITWRYKASNTVRLDRFGKSARYC